MARHPQEDGGIKNPKPDFGSKHPHGRISSVPSADTGKQTISRFNSVWTLLSSSSYARLSRLSIARAIHNTFLRPPMLRHLLKQFKAPRSFWTGGGVAGSEFQTPRLNGERLSVCGAISTCQPQVVPIVHLRNCVMQPPKWWLHMRLHMTTFYTFVRSVDALSKLRCVCPWTYYNDTHRIAKTPGSLSGVG